MKRKVRIRKAQFGGAAAMEQTQSTQDQVTDQDIVGAITDLMQNGFDSNSIIQKLVDAGIEQGRVTQILSSIEEYIDDERALQDPTAVDDQQEMIDMQTEQDAIAQQAAEEEEYKKRLAEMYYSDDSAEEDDAEMEDQFMQDTILQRRGGSLPSKRTFLKNTIKTLKAQQGTEMQQTKADSTDTGERAKQLADFVAGVQNTANEALMKKDAEEMYERMSSYMPEAQFGMNMRPGQARRFNRRVNRMIGQIPQPIMNTGFMSPYSIVTAPMLGGFSAGQYAMPAFGSYAGGPRLANIDVRRTGLFGRPKEYTINFAQEAYYNPKLKEDVVKQEAENKKESQKDVSEKNAAVKSEEEKDSKFVTFQPTSTNTATTTTTTRSNNKSKEIVQSTPVAQPVDANNPMDALVNKKYTIGNIEVPMSTTAVNAKSKYSGKFNDPSLTYYNPDKPGYLYGYQDGKLYYDAPDAGENWIEVSDPNRISQLNEKLRGADLFTLPTVKGYYYRQRPDGSFSKFQGDPKKHSSSAKQVSIIKPGDANYDYLNKAKQFKGSYSGKQFGGYVDPNSDLTKFIYGGDEDFSLPEITGKLIDSPYFERGGLVKYQGDKGGSEVTTGMDIDPGFNINPATGKPWTRAEWEEAKRKGEEERKAAERRNAWIDQQIEAAQSGSYPGYGYNSYSPYVFPGGYAKQQGLPYDPETGEVYRGYISPYTNLNKIDVRKSSWLTGMPKKYTMYFGNEDPTASQFSLEPKSSPSQSDNEKRNKLISNKGFLKRKGPINEYSDFDEKIDRTLERFRDKRLERKNKEYGGLIKGQTGVGLDPRFAPVYTDNPDYVGLTDLDLISPQVPGIPVTGATNLTGDWSTPITSSTPSRSAEQMATDPSMTIDPNQANRQTQKKNIAGDFAVDVKQKMSGAERRQYLDLFNAGANRVLDAVGEIGDRERLRKMNERYLADNLYGSTGVYDRGTYDTNSGLFRPDEMGFTGVVKYGGHVEYEEGGETWMSEEDIKRFLEEGGELEFV